MSTELERRLREALHEDAQRARLVNPLGPPAPEAQPLIVDPHRRSSARRPVAAAAAVALVVAAGLAVAQTREPDLTTEDPVAEDLTDPPIGDAKVFTGIPPGSTVELPPGPISQRSIPAVAWTGTEMIVWAGMDAEHATLDDGAVFSPATSIWRLISPAPIEPRLHAATAWTGTEMLVWGGQTQYANGASLTDGAAYDPRTDTWRLLPGGPFDGWEAGGMSVWTGDELIVVGTRADQSGETYPMAGYDPATDEWRRLADVPEGTDFDLVWAGEVLLTTVTGYSTSTGEPTGTQAVGYDPTNDTWQPLDDLASDDVSLLAVPDAAGGASTVLALAHETGAPIIVLDQRGEKIGTLPAIPADPAIFGDMHADGGVWAGEEILFWLRPLGAESPTEHWALNPAAETWRRIGADEAPPVYFDPKLVADAGVLVGWSAVVEPGGPSTGIAYRPPTPAGG